VNSHLFADIVVIPAKALKKLTPFLNIRYNRREGERWLKYEGKETKETIHRH
jgi:hypothetical protein